MGSKVPAPHKPTILSYFRTGLYTRRSALFAPIKIIGIQAVILNDALIDGQDMELLDTYQLQRRPGFSRFCSQQLAGGEIVNSFVSARNSAGTLFPLVDTNQRLASFSTSAITTLWNKGGLSSQSFVQVIGNQMYIANGAANGQKRYDTLTASLHNMGIPGPAAALTIPAPNIAGSTFWQPNTNFNTIKVILLDPNGNFEYYGGAANVTTGTQPPQWATTFGGVTIDGTVAWSQIGPPTVWQANHTFLWGEGQALVDSNGFIQKNDTGTGTTGATQPTWNVTIGGTTADNTVTWRNLGIGKQSVFSGYFYVYVYSTQAPTVSGGYYHCSSASPTSFNTGVVFGTYAPVISGAFSTNTDVGSVDIYRTRDGGSFLEYAGSVVNNTGGGTWTFTDNVIDSALDASLVVPVGATLLSDPPPGQTGTHSPAADAISYITYWQGRLWGASRNKVFFTPGPDIDNGDPNACWPPANVFSFPGPVIALTSVSQGLLVWLPSAVKFITGGPETLSFYDTDLLDNFGISSPNCVSKDGDTVRVLTTQGQIWRLDTQSKTEESNFIGDIIQGFSETNSYLTTHRNGLDNGAFISNGSDTVMRMGLNTEAWSPQYKPVNGIKALRSVETSIGNYTLCAARATAAGFILGRDLTSFQDEGQVYSKCFVTIGSIVLSPPLTELVPVYYVAGYFAPVGTIPTVSVLANEITGTSGPGFVVIPEPQDEPNYGATASVTILAKQWNLYVIQSMKNSLLMHHLQVRFDFPQEAAANTIYGMALKHDMEGY